MPLGAGQLRIRLCLARPCTTILVSPAVQHLSGSGSAEAVPRLIPAVQVLLGTAVYIPLSTNSVLLLITTAACSGRAARRSRFQRRGRQAEVCSLVTGSA